MKKKQKSVEERLAERNRKRTFIDGRTRAAFVPVVYTDYDIARDSSLLAVFDRDSNNVIGETETNAGFTPDIDQALEGYVRLSQSSSSVINSITQQLTLKTNMLLTFGMAPWIATTPYQVGSSVTDTDGNTYKCIIENTNQVPHLTPSSWARYISSSNGDLSFLDAYLFGSMYRIGESYPTFTSSPPYTGSVTFQWLLLGDGAVLMTGLASQAGLISGTNRADTGTTGGHELTADENGEHDHVQSFIERTDNLSSWIVGTIPSGEGTQDQSGVVTKTASSGKGIPHTHPQDIKNIKCCVWKRTA
jgi:hypothetical protein